MLHLITGHMLRFILVVVLYKNGLDLVEVLHSFLAICDDGVSQNIHVSFDTLCVTGVGGENVHPRNPSTRTNSPGVFSGILVRGPNLLAERTHSAPRVGRILRA